MSPSSRRWVVDGQVLQTQARLRGMGHYSFELVRALAESEDCDLRVILTSALDVEPARAELTRRAPTAAVDVLDLRLDTPGDSRVPGHNVAVLDAYLEQRDEGASFLLLSAMQGTVRPVLPRRPGVQRWTLVYDLIPLMFPDLYLNTPLAREEYEGRLANIVDADGLLAISRTVANDIVMSLGVPADRIVTINGAPVDHAEVPQPVGGVTRPFILMPTGNNARKNNRRAILAFDRFNARHDHAYTLVVTSTFTAADVAELSALSERVLFTGAVTGEQMAFLYGQAQAVLFPPEYEGLGLPLLEAMEHRAPVACSDIPVFREIAEHGLHYFDPESVTEMALALEQAVQSDPSDPESERARRAALDRYTWPQVRHDFLEGTRRVADALPGPGSRRDRVALELVGPAPGGDNPAAALVRDLGWALSRASDVAYVLEHDEAAPSHTARALRSRALVPGAALDAARRRLYVVSGSSGCALTLMHALGSPGLVCLLDLDLTPAWDECVRRGLVSPSRARVEERLVELEPSDVAHVLALLSASPCVVVFRRDHQQTLTALAERYGLTTAVELLPYPVAALPYPELMDDKTVDVVDVPPVQGATRENAEHRLTTAVARAAVGRLRRFDAGTVLHTQRLGTIPWVPQRGEDLGVVDGSVLTAGIDADEAVAAVVADADVRRRMVQAARDGIEKQHAPGEVVRALVHLVTTQPRDA